ncbi:hypothetical protein, partial [Streptomyces europaeiscabiei]|uniref:hypothetical protein n=1 Tax=Streptomyces europaeiscabiei TaxID=146819 RepID=UPI001FCA0570
MYALNSRYEDGLAEGSDLRGLLLRATGDPRRRDGALGGDGLSDGCLCLDGAPWNPLRSDGLTGRDPGRDGLTG